MAILTSLNTSLIPFNSPTSLAMDEREDNRSIKRPRPEESKDIEEPASKKARKANDSPNAGAGSHSNVPNIEPVTIYPLSNIGMCIRKCVYQDKDGRDASIKLYVNHTFSHFEQCQNYIRNAVNGKSGKLLMFVPDQMESRIFRDIVKTFDKVCMVGLSITSMYGCFDRLPEEEKKPGKFTIIQADLTGAFVEVERIVGTSKDKESFTSAQSELEKFTKNEFGSDLCDTIDKIFGKANLIISSLYPSQIDSFMNHFLHCVVTRNHLEAFVYHELKPWIRKASIIFERNHFRDLHRLLTPDGNVCFIDTIDYTSGKGLLSKEAIGEKNRLFHTKNLKQHLWVLTPNTTEYPDHTLNVECSTLVPKDGLRDAAEEKKDLHEKNHAENAGAGAGAGSGMASL